MTAYGLSCPSVLGSVSVFALDIASGGHKAHKRPSGGGPFAKNSAGRIFQVRKPYVRKFVQTNFLGRQHVARKRESFDPAPMSTHWGSVLQERGYSTRCAASTFSLACEDASRSIRRFGRIPVTR